MQRRARLLTILLAAAAVAACGGQAPSPAGGATSPGSTAGPGATTPPAAPASAAGNPDVGPLNTAVVIIGDDRYEFTDVTCSIFTEGYIQAINSGGDPEVWIHLPPEGWESQGDTFGPPEVRVQIGDESTGQRWVAGEGYPLITPLAAGASQVDSYTVPAGRPVTATGMATFVDVVAHNTGKDAPSVSGSFEVTCP